MTSSGVARLTASVMAQFAPPPSMTVSEWADREVRLPPESSAEPGQWRTVRAPYQRAIMDAAQDPTASTVVLMASSQTGKTQCLLNILLYHIDLDPCPILIVEPTVELGQAISKDRIAPMLRDTPAIARKLATRLKDAAHTTMHRTFPGGHLTLAGANAPTALASRPIRLLLADEVDRFPPHVGEEGDPLALAIKRTTTFWNKKVFIVSTPTVKGASRIEAWYESSDQRRFFVPCPRCGVRHELEWRNVRWNNHDPATAHLVCPACEGRIEDHERAEMIKGGEWRATAPFHGIAGFFIWECYSPWVRLSKIVADFKAAREHGAETMRAWTNTSLGQSWEEEAEHVEPHLLLARREAYGASVPLGCVCLTLGVDTQDDRLEWQVVGWGPGEEAWVIELGVIPGDPSMPEVWRALDDVRTQPWPHATGLDLYILSTAIDSAGHRTDHVYDYVRRRLSMRCYATIGRDGDRPAVSERSHRGTREKKLRPITLGVDGLKALLYSRLRLEAPGPGYVHIPADRAGFDEEWALQVTAERLVTAYSRGVPYKHWKQVYRRNEALDTFVLNVAALRLLNPKLERMADHVREAMEPPPPPDPTTEDPGSQPARTGPVPRPAPPGRRVFRSNFMNPRR